MEIIKIKNLEQLLRTNWASFIDKSQLLANILIAIRDANLPQKQLKTPPERRGIQLTVSRIELQKDGFLVWLEFSIPQEHNITIGTLEAILGFDGTFIQKDIIGNNYDYKTLTTPLS